MLKAPSTSSPQMTTAPCDSEKAVPGSAMGRKHVRGSSLLLVGRGLAILINFAVQVLVVRYLTVAEFGAFAFGLSTVVLLTKMAELGLGKGLSRFLPIYHEQQDYPRVFGAIALGIGTVGGLGITIGLIVIALQGLLLGTITTSPLSLNVLLVMVMLTPLQALEDLMEKLFAVFAGAKAVFFRRHLVGPLLKLAAVGALIATGGSVYVLTVAYVIASAIGALITVRMFVQVLRRQGLLQQLRWRELKVPVREIFSFSLPLISSDLVFLLRASLVVLLLELLRGNAAVAAFRAVFPVARLNSVVFDSFKTLFIPTASRLFAREDHEGMNDLYWRNATWMAVLTYPIFIVTFSLAESTTWLLFGSRYTASAPIMAVLSLGCFINVVFGFNTLMLRVYGKVRPIVVIDLATAAVALATNLLSIHWYGALGGAVATSSTLVLQNIAHQVVLARVAPIRLYDPRFARVAGAMLAAAFAILLLEQYSGLPAVLMFVIAGVTIVAALWINIKHLDMNATFPEIKRVLPARVLAWLG